jgi:hypothetical protein
LDVIIITEFQNAVETRAIRVCPAVILAASRIPRAIDRAAMLINSIITIGKEIINGHPIGRRESDTASRLFIADRIKAPTLSPIERVRVNEDDELSAIQKGIAPITLRPKITQKHETIRVSWDA